MPDFPTVPIVPPLDLTGERIADGMKGEFVVRTNRRMDKIELFTGTVNTAFAALNVFSESLNDNDIIQARLNGYLNYDTKAGLDARGAPPNAGTDQEPRAVVHADTTDVNGLYRWNSTNSEWVRTTPWHKGDTGDPGDPGDDGEQGDSAYALAQSVGFSGSLQQWLDSLKGDQGDTGESAYDYWLDQGNTGTEAEWYATLQGIQGIKGDKGDGIGSQIDGQTTELLIERVTGAANSPSVGELQTDPATGRVWIGSDTGAVELGQAAANVSSSSSTGSSTLTMLEYFPLLHYWLAPQDAASDWPNRGQVSAPATLAAGADVSVTPVDFRPVGIVSGSGVTLPTQPFNVTIADAWTFAFTLKYEGTDNSGGFSNVFNCSNNGNGIIIFARSTGTLGFSFYENSVNRSVSSTVSILNQDATIGIAFDGPKNEGHAFVITDTQQEFIPITPADYGDSSPGTSLQFAGSNSNMNGELGDVVVDGFYAWNTSTIRAAAKAMSLRYVDERDVVRRVWETSRKGALQAGQGIRQTAGILEVLPDQSSTGDVYPVNVGLGGTGVNARLIGGHGGGAPIDFRGSTFKPSANGFGSFVRIDGTNNMEMRPVPGITDKDCGVIHVWNSGNTDNNPYGAGGVTISGDKIIPAGGFATLKVVGPNTWVVIGGKGA